MPHLPAWDESQPLGSADAGTIDDIFRDLKLQIRSRMNEIVVDWTADPIVLKSSAGSPFLKTGVMLTLPGYLGSVPSANPVTVANTYIETLGLIFFPLPIEKKWKITNVEFQTIKDVGTTITAEFWKTSFDTGATATLLNTAPLSANGIQISGFSGLTEIADGNSYYWLKFTPAGGGAQRLYSVRITYDETA